MGKSRSSSEESDMYTVERILDKRKTKKGRNEYLVKWFGWTQNSATWEPE